MFRQGVKIYKFINQRSALDITPNLQYYKEKNDELEYKGSLAFSITSNNEYLRAYVSKSKAKVLFRSIIDGNFSKFYPNGMFEDYGGSVRDGKVVARVLRIEMLVNPDPKDSTKKKTQIRFTISEGPGQKTKTGAFKMTGKPTTFVQSYLDPQSMRECALEVLSFIETAELVGQITGKPLYTLTGVDKSPAGSHNLFQGRSENASIMDFLDDIKRISNQDLKKLVGHVNEEYKKRVDDYQRGNR